MLGPRISTVAQDEDVLWAGQFGALRAKNGGRRNWVLSVKVCPKTGVKYCTHETRKDNVCLLFTED